MKGETEKNAEAQRNAEIRKVLHIWSDVEPLECGVRNGRGRRGEKGTANAEVETEALRGSAVVPEPAPEQAR